MAPKDWDLSDSMEVLIEVKKELFFPATAKVIDNIVKILFVFGDGMQRLITYDSQGNVDCTVQDLLDITDIPDEKITVFILNCNHMGINYIAKVGNREILRPKPPEF